MLLISVGFFKGLWLNQMLFSANTSKVSSGQVGNTKTIQGAITSSLITIAKAYQVYARRRNLHQFSNDI
jgi:hypothetical protein